MKKILLFSVLILLSIMPSVEVAAENIIIDYTCTDLSQVPQQFMNAARDQFNIIFFRTSHGSQITYGTQFIGLPFPNITEVSDDLLHLGDTSFVQKTRDRLGNPDNPKYNLVWWAWCSGIADNTSAGINAYLQAMEGLESEYPGVLFVYATGPLWHPGDIGTRANNEARNMQIRNWIATKNNKIFFDFESFDACNPDGNCFWDSGTDACEWCSDWCFTQTCPSCSEDCPHSHCFNCIQKGRAFWWMMARLMGWNPNTQDISANFFAQPITGVAPLEVDFTDLSSGNVTAWIWDFENDGNPDSNWQNPTYIYSDPGSYSVRLEVLGLQRSDAITRANYIRVLEDSDGDGISDEEEDSGPNGGDGNNDGLSDSLQENVACFQTYDGQYYVTVESPPGTTLTNCRAVENPSKNTCPSNVQFNYGFFEFVLEGVNNGSSTEVILYLPNRGNYETYYKYGATPDNFALHCYEFLDDGETGAQIDGNVLTLYFVDGLRGDDDLTANGSISDIGGPASVISSNEGKGGGGGGCFISTLIF